MNDPPENTALLSAEYLLSPVGITLPNHGRKISSCCFRASVEVRKITPCFASSSLMLEYAASESYCASTPARNARSCSGTPSRSNVRSTSSGTSSHDRFGRSPSDR